MKQLDVTSPTPLEIAVLAKFVEVYPMHRDILEVQLSSMRISSREISKTGFYLNFETDKEPVFETDMELNRVYANIDGLEFGAGFILFIREKRIRFLEGYSYEEEWPRLISRFEVYTDLQVSK